MTTAHETLHEVTAAGRKLRDAIPDVYSGYAALSAAAMGEGVLPGRIKELIALAIAVTRECDGCVASHARSAARRGATAEEVAEALGVAILMNGGPGTVWGPRAYAAFREYAGQDLCPWSREAPWPHGRAAGTARPLRASVRPGRSGRRYGPAAPGVDQSPRSTSAGRS